MNIEALLNKYFEGETTCKEERKLRRFFASRNVPEPLQIYSPLFAALTPQKQKFTLRRTLLYSLSGAAAGLLLLLGIAGIGQHFKNKPENYVIIDGKQYTDARLVREQAVAAFQEVSLDEEEVFNTLFE